MEFALSSEQVLLQQSASRALERAAPLERVRKAAAAKDYCPEDVWTALCDLGVPSLLIGEEFGGAEQTLLEAALAAEMLGRHVTPAPFVAACVMAPIALAIAASPEQKRAWLPKLACGAARASVAVSRAAAGERGAGVAARNGALEGTALFALDPLGADLFIVADTENKLRLVEKGARGLSVTPMQTIDATRAVAEVRFADTPAAPLPRENAFALRRMIDAGRVVLAADTLGAAARMLEKAVAYAGEREQFGRLIGSFQAVKHMCAEMAAEIEPARSLLWYAAYAFDAAPEDASRMACHAKAHLSEVGTFVARTATEVHGGMGFTDLLGLHYWFKRIGFNRQILGGPERLRGEAAVLQGWTSQGASL